MIVDRLEVDPRRRESVRVIVEGRPVWTVACEVVRELGLFEGCVIPSGGVARLEAAAEDEGAIRAAHRLIERRAHSRMEMRRKLLLRGHAERSVDAAIEHLTRLRLLDDHAFAKQYIASRGGRGQGPTRLRHDLEQLGVARELIADAVSEFLAEPDNDPWPHTLLTAQRRAATMAGLPLPARQRRLMAFFHRRGFTDARAREAVEQLSSG